MNERKLFKKKIGEVDFPLLVATILLVVFGVVAVFSASYYSSLSREGGPYSVVMKQFIYAIIGGGLMYVASKMDYHRWKDFSPVILIGTFAGLILVLTPVGLMVNGARRWISLGFITVMPGEIAKFAIIIFVASFLSANPKKVNNISKGLLPIGAVTMAAFLLILLQPNLSVGATLLAIVIGMMISAGLRKEFVVMGVGSMIFGLLALIVSDPNGYRMARMTSFLHPFENASGESFQVVQSLLALGSGGLGGVGIGESIQKTMYLPEPHNDFILAIIGEEVGLVGIMVLLVIYVIFLWRGILVAIKAKDMLGFLLASGIVIMVGTQVVFNLAVVTSSMPATGVALPFISYGGNALWIFMVSAGILLNISRKRTLIRNYQIEPLDMERYR